MAEADSTPGGRETGVRTLSGAILIGSRPCPVCRTVELQGNQTACSPACRRRRSRDRETETRRERDQGVLALLERAGELLAAARRRLGEDPLTGCTR